MDSHIQTTAEAAARLLLARFRAEYPAWANDKTPLDELSEWLGLQVETFHPDDYPQGTYGFMDPDEDEQLIWLCRDLGETLRRFTLAHEMGHAVLHCRGNKRVSALMEGLAPSLTERSSEPLPALSREDPCHDHDVQEDMTGLLDQEQFEESLGIGESYDPRSQRELAANIFAAELLMPIERVRTLYLRERVPPTRLASIFGVSNAAMLNRLAGLLKEGDSASASPQQQNQAAQGTSVGDEQAPAPIKQRYDEFQRAAIEAPAPALIVAGPGSGKTSTLIGRVEHMVMELGILPQHILALTFSRKAAREMEERLQRILNSDNAALPRVSTFHAFCADILRQYAELAGLRPDFSLIDEAEGYFLLRQMSNEIRLRHYLKLQAPAYYFPDMLKAISRAKDELVTPEEYARLAQHMKERAGNEEEQQKAEQALEVAHVYSLYESALARRGDTDFGGLLVLTVRLFREHPEVLQEQQQRYQHILVDEFQDMNRASAILLRELAGEARRVWVVGDANQAIYRFRGASPANIRQFTVDFPGATVLPLSRNYRSRPDLVALAESFRCLQLEPEEEPGKNQPARAPQPEAYVTLAEAPDDKSELAGLVQDIRYRQMQGYTYGDMVVLCRTRAQAQKITRALAGADLPVIERSGVLEQDHIKDVISILLLLADQSGMGLLRAARQPEHPFSQEDVEMLLMAAYEQKKSVGPMIFDGEAPLPMSLPGQRSLRRLSEILNTLHSATDLWSLLAQYLLIETSLARDLLARSEDKQWRAILAEYDRLLQLARHYDQQQQHLSRQQETDKERTFSATEQPSLLERVKGFLEYLSLLVLLRQDGGNRESAEERGEGDANVIRVMTVHASKGLEFPIVYMPGLVQRRFPLQARSSPITAPQGMLPEESIGNAAHESGEACLFYVGVTRAREHLILSYSERYGKQKYKRSPYLDALEAGLPPERITRMCWEAKGEEGITSPSIQTTLSSQPGERFIECMKPRTLSASAIEAYQRCPRQYAYSYVYHFTSDADTYQLFRQATQKTLETVRKQLQEASSGLVNGAPTANAAPTANGVPTEARIPTRQEIQDLYTQHWQALGGHTAPFSTLYEEHGHEVVELIRRKLIAEEDITWDMRSNFTIDVAGKTVQVTVDRVEAAQETGQPIKFVRARFGRRKEKPTAEMRDLFYALASRQHHPDQSITLHSHNMSTGEVVPIKLTEKKEQSLYNELEQSVKGIERNEYPAQPAEPYRCPTCPFFLICPA